MLKVREKGECGVLDCVPSSPPPLSSLLPSPSPPSLLPPSFSFPSLPFFPPQTATDNIDCENKLVLLLNYEQFDFIKILRKNRWTVLYCTQLAKTESEEARKEIEEEMKVDPEKAEVLKVCVARDAETLCDPPPHPRLCLSLRMRIWCRRREQERPQSENPRWMLIWTQRVLICRKRKGSV